MKNVYKITKETKVLINKDSNYFQTRIIELNRTKRSIFNAEEILAQSCVKHGSGIEGRREYAINILGTKTNLPIAVGPDEGVYMLPTAPLNNKHCVLLSYYHIKSFEPRDHKLYVEFYDETGLYIDVSLHMFNIQMEKTAQVIAAYQREDVWSKL